MKFTWGHAITLVFILFASYILYFVYRSFNTEIDLVSEDYYAQEVAFQSRINATANAKDIAPMIEVEYGSNGIMLVFPEAYADIESGTVRFFRPSDQDLDRHFPLELDADHRMFFPAQLLSEGRYELQLSWLSEGVEFYVSKDITI